MNQTIANAISLRLRTCFYLLWPSETYFPSVEEMPNLVTRVVPVLTIAMALELIILRLQGRKNNSRFNEALITWSQTAMYDGFSIFLLRGAELTLYIWVYDNFRIVTFDWNSLITWMVALLSVEFLNYWWHRFAHEIAIMWAAHELHHSSEDFNLSTAFRNNSTMRFFRWIFFVPLAPFGIPAAVMWTHVTLGSIFNTFAHSALTPKLHRIFPGVGHCLEFIFVTPSHHRVHHGANKYCIDKNYGQYLIIWDRLFGTFVEEKDDEPITYGTLSQLQTKNVSYLQVCSFVTLWKKVSKMSTFGDKLRAIFYGPGWMPGKPRLGDPIDIPDVRGRKKWDRNIPKFINLYLILNVFSVVLFYVQAAERLKMTSAWIHFINIVYIYYGFTTLGFMFDGKAIGIYTEATRIILLFGLLVYSPTLVASANFKLSLYWLNTFDLFALPYMLNANFFIKQEIKVKEN